MGRCVDFWAELRAEKFGTRRGKSTYTVRDRGFDMTQPDLVKRITAWVEELRNV